MKKSLFLFAVVFTVLLSMMGCKESVLPEEITTTTTTSLPDYEEVKSDFYESTNANVDLATVLLR